MITKSKEYEMAERVKAVLKAKGKEISIGDAVAAVGTVFQGIANDLGKGKDVRVRGFGEFKAVDVAERTGINPATGEKINIKAHRVARFKASGVLTSKINTKRDK